MKEIGKLFLKDFFTKKKLLQYVLLNLAFVLLLETTLKDTLIISNRALIITTMIVLVPATFYLLSTYTNFHKVRSYISLPYKSRTFLGGFLLSVLTLTFFEKSLLLLVLAGICGQNIVLDITCVILMTMWSVSISIALYLGINSTSIKTWIVSLISCILIAVSFLNIKMQLLFVGIACLFSIRATLSEKSISLINRRGHVVEQRKVILSYNYFLQVLIHEKIYFINTAMLLGFTVLLVSLPYKSSIFPALMWAIGAVNTPVLTMFSANPQLRRQNEMLPAYQWDLRHQYLWFLIGYFSIYNLLVALCQILFLNGNIMQVIPIALITACIEVVLGYILEIKYPLTNWQTKQDLWKHPRKYLISIIIFLLATFITLLAE